jgi:hypothetical protein
MRPALKQQTTVACLVLGSLPAEDEMLDVLARWMRFERRDFYRVQVDGSQAVCFLETLTGQGVYWEGGESPPTDLARPPSSVLPWDKGLERLFGRTQIQARDQLAASDQTASGY